MQAPFDNKGRSRTEAFGWVRSRSVRRGTAALEFALVFPFFLVLIFGLIEFSRAMMVVSLLNNASRVGCREAILRSATDQSVSAAVDQVLSKQGIGGYATRIEINGQPAAITTAVTNDLIVVRVTVPFPAVSWLPSLRLVSGNLSGQYAMPRE